MKAEVRVKMGLKSVKFNISYNWVKARVLFGCCLAISWGPSENEIKQARKLQDAQTEKLTSLQANNLINWQVDYQTIRLTNDKMMRWIDNMVIW